MSRALLSLLAIVLAACTNEAPRSYQGYAEGEYVRVAAPFSGTLELLAVKRGTPVKAGDPLFTLEQENEAAARREARERLKNAEAVLADLRKSKRPSEIEAVRAQLAQAEAAARFSRSGMSRAAAKTVWSVMETSTTSVRKPPPDLATIRQLFSPPSTSRRSQARA